MAKKKKKLRKWHFDFGNSSTGPLGISGAVVAEDKAAALEIVRELLWEDLMAADPGHKHPVTRVLQPGIVYANCYVNTASLTLENCDIVEEDFEDGD